MQVRCIGEYPLFPGWLFFEERRPKKQWKICAYGPGGLKMTVASTDREHALAECVRAILTRERQPLDRPEGFRR